MNRKQEVLKLAAHPSPTSSSPIAIDRAGIDSLEIALDLLSRFFREEGFNTPVDQMRENLRTLLTIPTSAVFLACRNSKAVGVVTVTSSVGIEYGRSAELEDLYVLPGERGAGVGGKLIDEVIKWCSERGVSSILVTVTPEGEVKHHLIDYYLRRGFTNTRRLILERTLDEIR
jgi:GNAT superfamily N-acetyltransferase